MSPCCSSACAAIEKKFGEAMAKRELASYLEKGAGPTTRLLRDGIVAAGVPVETLLDVGAGIGALTFELLERGVRRAVAVDASAAFVAAARAEAHRRKREERTEWVHGDFVALADELGPADGVTLDRVLCCYPRYEPLLTGAANRARHCLAASYPRDVWFVRFVFWAQNAWRALTGDEFRTVVHPAVELQQLIRSHGFSLASRRETWIWSVDVYVRAAAATG
jgi:magnesium-protoporphyrin O-methyltransferase